MNFKNYINELFDNPYHYKKVDASFYQFFVGEDHYEVELFRKEYFSHEAGKTLEGIEISFQKNGYYDVDKSLEPFRVFATVIDMAKKEKASEKDFIEFGAQKVEKSKVKLYNKMAKVFVKKLNWETYTTKKNADSVTYVLFKKKY